MQVTLVLNIRVKLLLMYPHPTRLQFLNEYRLARFIKEVLKVFYKSKVKTPAQTLKLNEKRCKTTAVNLQSLSGMLSANNRYKSVISHGNWKKHGN